jgi:glycosyltransferase involved in cell wall biosynthesis
LVTELHESCLPEKDDKKLRVKFQKLFYKVNGLLFTNQSQIKYLTDHKYDLSKYQIVLPNGVNVSAFSKACAASFKSKPVVLTYTGQFTAWKNVPLIFEALHYLPKYFHLRIAGGKENSALSNGYVNELISEFSLAGRVDYLGFIHPNELIEKVINGSSILLLPLGDSIIAQYATSPMKLVEYMATSIPVVAVDTPSVRGLSKPGSIFLAKSNAKEFSKEILNAYKTKSDLLRKRILNQNTIAKKYDFSVRARKYNVWLNELI